MWWTIIFLYLRCLGARSLKIGSLAQQQRYGRVHPDFDIGSSTAGPRISCDFSLPCFSFINCNPASYVAESTARNTMSGARPKAPESVLDALPESLKHFRIFCKFLDRSQRNSLFPALFFTLCLVHPTALPSSPRFRLVAVPTPPLVKWTTTHFQTPTMSTCFVLNWTAVNFSCRQVVIYNLF